MAPQSKLHVVLAVSFTDFVNLLIVMLAELFVTTTSLTCKLGHKLWGQLLLSGRVG